MGPILVLIEGLDEQHPVVRGLRASPQGGPHRPYSATMTDGTEVVICTTGVGPERAHLVSDQTIKRYEPSLVVSAGTCGSLTHDIERHDWVLTGEVRALSAQGQNGRDEVGAVTSQVGDRLNNLAQALGAGDRPPRFHSGTLVTVSGEPVVDAADKEAIVQAHGAVAVDMESYGIAMAAAENKVPWLVARVAVDTPTLALPDFGDLDAVTGRPSLWRIGKFVLAHPLTAPFVLYRLWETIQIYARHLVRVLPALTQSPDTDSKAPLVAANEGEGNSSAKRADPSAPASSENRH